jgi:hypothetical protein
MPALCMDTAEEFSYLPYQPHDRGRDDAPDSFRNKLLLLTRVARSRHNAGWHSMADKLRVKLRDVIRESDLSAAEQFESDGLRLMCKA